MLAEHDFRAAAQCTPRIPAHRKPIQRPATRTETHRHTDIAALNLAIGVISEAPAIHRRCWNATFATAIPNNTAFQRNASFEKYSAGFRSEERRVGKECRY